jgi:peptidoglycan/LPS O-acetylase OafA/YrhL
MARPNLPSLTGVRFIAALIVIIQHYTFRDDLFPEWLFLGYESVTFFFVLSGFILTYNYAPIDPNKHLDVSSKFFITARVARLIPAYLLALLLAMPLYLHSLVKGSISIEQFLIGAALVLAFLQAWVPDFALYWNPPAWSLSVELLFYLTFPIIWQLTRGLSDRINFIYAIFLVVAVGLFRHLYLDTISQDVTRKHFSLYFPLLHLTQFFLGIALGRLFVYQYSFVRLFQFRIFLFGLLGLAFLLIFHTNYPIYRNSAIISLICCAVILTLAQPLVILGWKPLSGKVMSILGDSSYSMYILHYPLLIWFNLATRAANISLNYFFDFLFYLSTVISISLLSFYLLERPSRAWILRRSKF